MTTQPTTFGFWICTGAKLTRRRASIGAAPAIIYDLDTAPGQPRPIIMVRNQAGEIVYQFPSN